MKNKFLYSLLFVFSSLFCSTEILLNDDVVDVEVQIISISKTNDAVSMKDVDMYGRAPVFYEVVFGVYNPYVDIAGFQFNLQPEDLISINKENVSGGAVEGAGFNIYVGKGTILGFSMQGTVIPSSQETQVLFSAKADIREVKKYIDSEITANNLVIASKAGKTLSSKFIPFKFEDIDD